MALPVPPRAGREQLYLERFYQDLAYDTEAIRRYVRAFARPGAMRAGFELYRAFPADDAHNRAEMARDGKLAVPVLAMAGVQSAFAPFTEAMMREVAADVAFRTVERANHWVPEENAEGLAAEILAFIGDAAPFGALRRPRRRHPGHRVRRRRPSPPLRRAAGAGI